MTDSDIALPDIFNPEGEDLIVSIKDMDGVVHTELEYDPVGHRITGVLT